MDYLYSNSKVVIGEKNMKEIILDIETSSLEPFEDGARVYCIGVRCGEFNEVLMHTSERKLLEMFWGLPFFEGYFRLITFNGFFFDLPYLIVRSFRYGIKIPDIKGRSIDLRFVLSYGNKFKKGKLIDYSKLILGKEGNKLKDCDGSKVKDLWDGGKHKKLREYCQQDVFLTHKVHERLKKMEIL